MKEKLQGAERAFFTFALVAALILSLLGGIATLPAGQALASGGSFGGGSGTPDDPFLIEDVDDLQAVKNNLTAYYALNNSIDASNSSGWNGGLGFEPIGNATNRFSGGFDGRGFNITGLYINRPGSDNVGLFGHVGDDTGATNISNVCLLNTTVVGGRGVGTLIGRVTGNANTVVQNCSAVGGNVTGRGSTGGLIGAFNSWQTTPAGTNNPVLRYSYSNVTVYSSANGNGGRDRFGGLVGCSKRGTIQNSYSRSSVTVANASRIGGLAGCLEDRGEIFNCYSTGNISVTNCTLFGGLVGDRGVLGINEGVVTNSFWDTETSGQAASAGGTGKNTPQMKTESTFTDAGWNFVEIWDMDSGVNDGYPYLIWTGFAPAVVSITGTFTANNKTYDGSNNATFGTNNLTLSGVAGSDNVTLVDVTIRFSDPYVATNKTVYITSAALAGTNASAYMLSLAGAPTATASITAKAVTPSITANNKTYDGTTNATLNATWLTGVIGSDNVTLVVGAAHFDTKDVGTNKTVTATGLSLTGAAAGNYTLSASNATCTANITPLTVNVYADHKSKVQGQPDPPLTYHYTPGLAPGDAFTGALARVAGEAVGTYPILQGSLNLSSNYVLNFTPATFAISPVNHSLILYSSEGGRVTRPGEGLYTYTRGMIVDLVATPDEGYRFVNWTEGVSTVENVNAASTTVAMWGDYAIKANFAPILPSTYTLTISSSAGGSVTSPGVGTFIYEEGTVVNLVATPAAKYRFVNWTGNVSTVANPNLASTTITMNGDYSITALFEAIPPSRYTLTISSSAGGSVITPGVGTFSYFEGTVVPLTAAPQAGYEFVYWSGDVGTIGSVSSASTNITMNNSYSIKANFSRTGGCFIATAAYGTPMAEEIGVLRHFRDEYMLTNRPGQLLVHLYYGISPPIADFIDEYPVLKPIVMAGLQPAIALSNVAVNTTGGEKMAMLVFLALVLGVVGVRAAMRRMRIRVYID